MTRKEIFVTTKMRTSDFDDGDAAVDASLCRLNLDYMALMILQHSQPSKDVDVYKLPFLKIPVNTAAAPIFPRYCFPLTPGSQNIEYPFQHLDEMKVSCPV